MLTVSNELEKRFSLLALTMSEEGGANSCKKYTQGALWWCRDWKWLEYCRRHLQTDPHCSAAPCFGLVSFDKTNPKTAQTATTTLSVTRDVLVYEILYLAAPVPRSGSWILLLCVCAHSLTIFPLQRLHWLLALLLRGKGPLFLGVWVNVCRTSRTAVACNSLNQLLRAFLNVSNKNSRKDTIINQVFSLSYIEIMWKVMWQKKNLQISLCRCFECAT